MDAVLGRALPASDVGSHDRHGSQQADRKYKGAGLFHG